MGRRERGREGETEWEGGWEEGWDQGRGRKEKKCERMRKGRSQKRVGRKNEG